MKQSRQSPCQYVGLAERPGWGGVLGVLRALCVYVASTYDLNLRRKLTREEGPKSSLLHGN